MTPPAPDPAVLAAALATVPDARGRAAPPRFKEGRVSLVLDVTGLDGDRRDALERDVITALRAVPGVGDVRLAVTSERAGLRLIVVASGKGGVGKSTVAANLAVAMARAGHATGLIDADIHGPSQPQLMATTAMKPVGRDGKLAPVMSPWGVPMLSVGNLVPAGQAVAWRGPMAARALGQLIDADWTGFPTIVVDLPPGTGDVQLSMIAKHLPAGAVIVSTPQDLALIDARRAIDLFTQAGVPVIGMVENMAGYACPACGVVSDPFGRGGAEAAAAELGIAFLGRIPLDIAIRTASDAGAPPAAGNGVHADAFALLAGRVTDWLATH